MIDWKEEKMCYEITEHHRHLATIPGTRLVEYIQSPLS